MASTTIAAACLCLVSLTMPADDDALVADLAARAIPLRTLDPLDNDLSDLAPLADVLGNVQVVQLGEASHGDGTAFTARRRLLRYLNQELGFDVLAWESGMNDLAVVEAELHGPGSAAEIATDRIARPWAKSAEALAVFEDARRSHATRRPIEMAGFDVQVGSMPDTVQLGQHMAALLQRVEGGALSGEQAEQLGDLTALAMSLQRTDTDGRRALLEGLDGTLAVWRDRQPELTRFLGAREHAFLGRSLGCFARFLHYIDGTILAGGIQSVAANTPRDVGMGENLVWLANEHFAGRRIVTWVATFHAIRGLTDLTDAPIDYTGLTTLGDVVWEQLGERAYTVAITCYRGASAIPENLTGRGEPFRIPEATPGSLEDLCQRTGLGDLFLDLRGLPADHPLREPRTARLMGHGDLQAVWPDHVDGVLFLEQIEASSLAQNR